MSLVNVLVVEDNLLNMELITDLLMAAGYQVIQAPNAEQALSLARSTSPHLILMDISLPGMDGLTATRTLKTDPTLARIPVIALTAHAMSGDADRILAAGCDGYIAKPLNTRTFINTVAHYLTESM